MFAFKVVMLMTVFSLCTSNIIIKEPTVPSMFNDMPTTAAAAAATTTTTAAAATTTTTSSTSSAPKITTEDISTFSDDRCDVPSLKSKIRFSLKSERNGTGPWISTVTGERITPTGVSGGESCPWTVRVGHDATTCPLRNRGVRLVATVETESNVTDAAVAALTDRRSQVPPPTTEYGVSLHHSEYKLDLRLVKWELAHEFCQQEGGDLVVINSREEAAVLMKMLSDHGQISDDPYENKQVWVGVHDRHSEGNFITVYGEPLADTGYVQWAIGEPNDLGGSEDCVSMLRYGNFNDEICTKKLAFICERPHYPTLYS